MAGEIQRIEPLNLPELHNARLRGSQRYYQLPAQHRNHKNQRIVKMPRVGCPS